MSNRLAIALLIPILVACGGEPAASTPASRSGSPATTAKASTAASSAPSESPPAESPSQEPSEEPSPAPSGPVQMLGCDQEGPAFPVTGLDAPAGAEQTDDPAAVALIDFLAGPDGTDLPASDWRELVRTKTTVLFAQDDPSGEVGQLVVARAELSDGAWTVVGSSQCRPRTWYHNSYGLAAEWKLSAKVAATATSFRALVTERACASGENASGRMAKPRIEYTDTDITITIGVRPLEGPQDCPANPATPLTIRLEEPLGDRQLFDGGSYPAVEVKQPK